MRPTDTDRAIERATWLASVAAALDEADHLAARLADGRRDCPEMTALRSQIAAIRREVEINQRAPGHPFREDPNQPFW